MLLPLPLLVLVAAARLSLAQFPFDSRNISESAWACNASAASVTLQFAGPPIARICGAEVPQPATAALPTLTLSGYAPPAGNATVTVLIVDRDAPSAAQPIRSPLRHMALSRVPAFPTVPDAQYLVFADTESDFVAWVKSVSTAAQTYAAIERERGELEFARGVGALLSGVGR